MKKTYLILALIVYMLLNPLTAFAESIESNEVMDIFIGTLEVKNKKVILTRCDISRNIYELKDAEWSDEKAVSNFLSKEKDMVKPVYAEVVGAYRVDGNKNILLVDSIGDITERKSCHLSDLF
ncbi:hypothetical protein [Acinetobacter haemolyticus]|uniref:hypothetical protein n=1 Tax=Acinetobacter haemolyticus TaxID=29430 RepID=UPI000C2C72D9|nr:hypothetical protein [Acinetobacter haemolyticus]ATZ67847.1 hypothetical protein BSR56_11145 [Acinetobacter haemolyticus]NAR89200.1 hypothetical protein [Acinetobacter haemolyticus]NAR96276.1 hypothetical protein [Acinetobacter haemolyticus]NAS09243.1 hypothetical protein [Acinetobacter haemolyticus]QDJ91628.1 hypothetical protein AhaeAN54_005810 [Acinetobacter haemolyticus]